MKTEKPKLTAKDHRCNAVRFLAERYIEAVDWTGYLKGYRVGNRFDSKWHTALEEMYHGIALQLHGMLVEMAGYDFVSYIETHAVDSAVPSVFIEEALTRAKLKRKGDE